MLTHSELMQYATVFYMALKLDVPEIQAHIHRETEKFPDRMAMLRVQAYRNVLQGWDAGSMAAIADVKVGF
jgi:hypothetical protein